MKCQSLSSGNNKKNIFNWSSAELSLRLVKVTISCDYYVILVTLLTLSIQTPQLLIILVLKFEQVQFTTHVVSKNYWMSDKQCRH